MSDLKQCSIYSENKRVSKSDFDVLMFSIYIERLLEQNESDMESYSDYELSKQLGITQSKIKNLKVKKQLLYPYNKFDWQESFGRVCKNATYEQEKIHININDPNLFIELKHFVESRNGRVDIQLNANSFVISVDLRVYKAAAMVASFCRTFSASAKAPSTVVAYV